MLREERESFVVSVLESGAVNTQYPVGLMANNSNEYLNKMCNLVEKLDKHLFLYVAKFFSLF